MVVGMPNIALAVVPMCSLYVPMGPQRSTCLRCGDNMELRDGSGHMLLLSCGVESLTIIEQDDKQLTFS
jgi:hypothetical protein